MKIVGALLIGITVGLIATMANGLVGLGVLVCVPIGVAAGHSINKKKAIARDFADARRENRSLLAMRRAGFGLTYQAELMRSGRSLFEGFLMWFSAGAFIGFLVAGLLNGASWGGVGGRLAQ